MTYMQALTVNDIHMEGSELCLNLRTWWINYSEQNGMVERRGDCIDITLRRNTAYMEPASPLPLSIARAVAQASIPYASASALTVATNIIWRMLDLLLKSWSCLSDFLHIQYEFL